MNGNMLLFVLLNFTWWLLTILQFCIFLTVILSWFPNARTHPVSIFVRRITEPILRPIRSFMPRTGMIDFSPIVAYLAIWMLVRIVENLRGAIVPG